MTVSLEKQLDLRKNIVLDLKKNAGLEGQKAQVVLALDFSGSMSSMYNSGEVQQLVERLLPLGLAFDDNGEVDFYLFHDGVIKMPENITTSNLVDYIKDKVMRKYSMGATNYAPVINAVMEDFTQTKKGFLGFSKKSAGPLDYPVYVIFITDGNNGDKYNAEQAIKNASKHGVFFQFVGIGHERFEFLQKLDNLDGRNIDNANFFKVDNLGQKTDQELYALLLTEFPSFVKEARSKNLIK